jgi:squalene-hopene/tetraprenyl-beta-curcumene cyclase
MLTGVIGASNPIWSTTAIPWYECGDHIGEEVAVEGPVGGTHWGRGGILFIDLGTPDAAGAQFSVIVPAECIEVLEANLAMELPDYLLGKTIRVCGIVGDANEPSLFVDDFGAGPGNQWNLAPGWEAHVDPDGNRMLKGEGLWQWAIVDQGFEWTDYTVAFRMRLEHGGLHLNLRLDDPYGPGRTRYFVGFRENNVYIDKESPHDTYSSGLAGGQIDLALGVWHDVKVTVEGAELKVSIDGVLQLEYHDPDPLTRGTVALETLESAPGTDTESSLVYVDDFRVTATSAEASLDDSASTVLELCNPRDLQIMGALGSREAVAAGLEWLQTTQENDGSWSYGEHGPNVGVTSLCVLALAQTGSPLEDPALEASTGFLVDRAEADGRICSAGCGWATYETSLAATALHMTRNADFSTAVSAAVDWLISSRNDENQVYSLGLACSDPSACWAHGGWGYTNSNVAFPGEDDRGDSPYVWSDLSNTQFAILALEETTEGGWYDADTEAWVWRCQDPEGGFGYMPTGAERTWGQESFGSMTAAGIWALLALGVEPQDARLCQAIDWLEANFSVEENPRHGADRHYYYLWTVARALRRLDEVGGLLERPELARRWRDEITEYLVAEQWEDGRWRNEDDVNTVVPADALVTAYALNALVECMRSP